MRKVVTPTKIPTREEMFSWMSRLSAGGSRLPGTPGGRRAEDLVEELFREIGFSSVVREPIPLATWEPGEGRVEAGDLRIPAHPIARAAFTSMAGVQGPLVAVGLGEADAIDGRDLSGKVAVAEVPFAPRPYGILRRTAHAVHDPDGTFEREPETRATWILPTFARAYSYCAARGASAFVGVLRDLRANRHRYHYPYASAAEVLPLPGVFVGRDHGARLLEAMRRGPLEGRVLASGKTGPGVTHNVLGLLPGESDGLVLVTSHHDSPFGGLVQDAGGMAAVLAMAHYFAAKPRAERPLSMIFLASAGNLAHNLGAKDFLIRHAHDVVPRLLLAVSLEHIAVETEEREGKLRPTGLVEPRGIFVTDRPELLDVTTLAVLGNDLRRTFIAPVSPDGGRVDGEAGPYFGAGIPAIGCISGPEHVLTDEDGAELVAVDELVPVTKTFIEIIEAFMAGR